MPKPHPLRDRVLKQLKSSFPHKLDLVVDDEVFPYEDVKAALKVLATNGPEYFRALHLYMFTTHSRADIAFTMDVDPSTAKRRLDRCVDVIMQYLRHRDIGPQDLYTVTQVLDKVKPDGSHYSTVVPVGRAAFPQLFPHADRNNF